MFGDLDWPLNASSLLSASAELLVIIHVATADHIVMRVQYSSGFTIRQRVLKRAMNTVNVYSKVWCKQVMCSKQREDCFRLNSRVFAINDVIHYVLSQFWLASLYKLVCIHNIRWGELTLCHIVTHGSLMLLAKFDKDSLAILLAYFLFTCV